MAKLPSLQSLPQALEVSRLLCGLQRSLVPGADSSVDFLCNKFSELIERLKRAEAGEKSEIQNCLDLEETLRSEEQTSDAERRRLEVATISAREESRKVESKVAESHEQLGSSREQLAALRSETEALAEKKKVLEELCRKERAKACEAQGRLRRQQLLRPQAAEDARRLGAQLQSLNLRCAAVVAEIDGLEGRTCKEEESQARMKSELLAEEEAQGAVLARAAHRREDLDQVRARVATLQEQLADRQALLQCSTAERQRFAERCVAVEMEIERRRSWMEAAKEELTTLQETERGAEHVQSETLQLHAQLRVAEEQAKHLEALACTKKAELGDTDDKFSKQTERMQQVEQQRDRVRAEAATADEEEAQVSKRLEQLRHDQAAAGGMRRNLESELQLLGAEAEKLRGELSFLSKENADAQQRLHLVSPAMQEARRRVKDLELQMQAARDEALHEKELTQRLEREADVCQEKLRALRDENVRLSEHCTELEVRLAETVRSPGRPFREEKASPGLGRASASTRPFRRDTDARDARRPMAPAPRAPAGGGASFRRSETDEGTQELTPATSKLQQITQWIRNEEERLSSSRLAGAGSA